MTTSQPGPLAHLPVLYREVLDALNPHAKGRYLDGTLGAGGHAWGILDLSRPDGKLIGLDVDPEALEMATQRLDEFGPRAIILRASYGQIAEILGKEEWSALDGILLDLGASSMQFDRAQRGFSFNKMGPLDMRFDPDGVLNAEMLVNEWPEEDLANVIFRYGEEPRARHVARAIVQARPLENSVQLAEIVARGAKVRRGGMHPATRTFQALRIAVNAELETLQTALPQGIDALRSGGRLAVIAFHSLEDRIVKQFFRTESRDCICPPEQLQCTCDHKAAIKEITRRPIRPDESEIAANPRARSARLRVAEKL
ncbi:MAG: 16S rRNA (cytosine(1402)-N(4))-methyltransferase RsmH [Chloroflexi bacterium]|nr:16S rRNA (cytosine(1402)-N(4))-methyltransferase RsmH [Chloroflexota bacterium]MQC26513.1 16S rRNA (cytosine(1402)-N(4))-methyltransferase RsmH [Chloroflexota bacterium]